MDYVTQGIEGLKVVYQNKILENQELLFFLIILILFCIALFIMLVSYDYPGFAALTVIAALFIVLKFNDVYNDKSYKLKIKVIPEEAKYFIDADVWKVTDKEGEIITLLSNEVFKGDED